MALVIFRSKVAADITMFAENARRIFEILGRPESARGVITADQVPDALQRLTAAVDQEKAQHASADPSNDKAETKGAKARGVGCDEDKRKTCRNAGRKTAPSRCSSGTCRCAQAPHSYV